MSKTQQLDILITILSLIVLKVLFITYQYSIFKLYQTDNVAKYDCKNWKYKKVGVQGVVSIVGPGNKKIIFLNA